MGTSTKVRRSTRLSRCPMRLQRNLTWCGPPPRSRSRPLLARLPCRRRAASPVPAVPKVHRTTSNLISLPRGEQRLDAGNVSGCVDICAGRDQRLSDADLHAMFERTQLFELLELLECAGGRG